MKFMMLLMECHTCSGSTENTTHVTVLFNPHKYPRTQARPSPEYRWEKGAQRSCATYTLSQRIGLASHRTGQEGCVSLWQVTPNFLRLSFSKLDNSKHLFAKVVRMKIMYLQLLTLMPRTMNMIHEHQPLFL